MSRVLAGLFLVVVGCGSIQAQNSAVDRGKIVYDRWCGICHDAGLPGASALQAKYKGEKPALLDQRTDLQPGITKAFVRNGISIMPRFRKTEVSDQELDDLAAFLARTDRSAAKK